MKFTDYNAIDPKDLGIGDFFTFSRPAARNLAAGYDMPYFRVNAKSVFLLDYTSFPKNRREFANHIDFPKVYKLTPEK